MKLWSRSRRRPTASNQRYVRACETWEDAHGSIHNDFDAGQWLRYCVWIAILDLGLNAGRLAWGRWLVETGRITEEVSS